MHLSRLRKPVPAPETALYRYVCFDTFDATLRNGSLRFSGVEAMEAIELPDRFEAHLPDWKIQECDAAWATRASENKWPREWSDLNTRDHVIQSFRQQTGVSSWTHQPESLPMWSVYGEGAAGVMLVAAVSEIEPAFDCFHENDDEIIFIDEVRYPEHDELRALPPLEITPVSVGYLKRPIFKWEAEIRLAVTRLRETPPYDLKFDPTVLLREIVIGPKANHEREQRVRSIAKEFAPGVPVRRADLLERGWS